jgi:hypothetical protein
MLYLVGKGLARGLHWSPVHWDGSDQGELEQILLSHQVSQQTEQHPGTPHMLVPIVHHCYPRTLPKPFKLVQRV